MMRNFRHMLFCGLAALTATLASASSRAACVLPVPDGGIINPSKPNIEGRIVSIKQGHVFVGPKRVAVRLTKDTSLHTAFGGIVSVGEIKAGQSVAVWFVGCKHPGNSFPVAAYFQIFSKTPNDQP